MLSTFRIMWLQVIFDLPVKAPEERRKATQFRNFLLDLGFEMEQFSVYLRYCVDKTFAERMIKEVEAELPSKGSVRILMFTDKQYENVVSYDGVELQKIEKKLTQLALF